MCRVGDGPLAMLHQSDREERCRPFIARLMIGSRRIFSHEIVNQGFDPAVSAAFIYVRGNREKNYFKLNIYTCT